MQFFKELERVMMAYLRSDEGYTDEEMRVLKHLCKAVLAGIQEFVRKKEEKKRKERKERKEKRKGKPEEKEKKEG